MRTQSAAHPCPDPLESATMPTHRSCLHSVLTGVLMGCALSCGPVDPSPGDLPPHSSVERPSSEGPFDLRLRFFRGSSPEDLYVDVDSPLEFILIPREADTPAASISIPVTMGLIVTGPDGSQQRADFEYRNRVCRRPQPTRGTQDLRPSEVSCDRVSDLHRPFEHNSFPVPGRYELRFQCRCDSVPEFVVLVHAE